MNKISTNNIATILPIKKELSFIISGGGTGGHIYPAIAIANELKLRYPDSKFLFVGAKSKMEMQKIPQAGYSIEGLWISGLQRKLTLQNMLFPLKLSSSLWKSYLIIKKFKPTVVIGTGGFASGPLLQMANMLKIPTLIQEQNSYPGITNKLLGKKANKICVAYENLEKFFPKDKLFLTGNPVRQDLLNVDKKKAEGIAYFKLDKTKKTVLILGGSLGSRRINQLIEKELSFFKANEVQIIWQCGKLYFDEYKKFENHYKPKKQILITVLSFIDQMNLVYAAADIIISRAGASSISELCIVGKPVIFIPSPNVAEDHQTKNAQFIVNKNGALVIKESELNLKFEMIFLSLLNNEILQNELSKNIKSLAFADATKDIVDQIISII